MKIGFDNQKYLTMQSQHIKERISNFGNKLYLELGGKLFDDYHASRVLPGFAPDSKLQMLLQLANQAEMIISINADDIEANKVRQDLNITYDVDVIRLIGAYRNIGLTVSSVVITQYKNQKSIPAFRAKLEELAVKVYFHYPIDGYPSNVNFIVSDAGYGKNEYVETTQPLVIVTAPGPGSGKMATCLSQLYHENKRGIKAGYAKFETFPIWNLPLTHPVNIAYEAATADIHDVNMIDPFHLEAYQQTAVNYNRDIEVFPVLEAIFKKIYGDCPYKSPTDMGVNMAGFCICDDEVCREASRQEVIRRYFTSLNKASMDKATSEEVRIQELLMKKLKITPTDRPIVKVARELREQYNCEVAVMELTDGTIITGRTKKLLGACSAVILNSIKVLGGVNDAIDLISPNYIEPMQKLKVQYLNTKDTMLYIDEVLIALSMCAVIDPNAEKALAQLSKLKHCQLHVTGRLAKADFKMCKKLGIELTNDI